MLEAEAVEALRRTRPWMYFLAVVTVILCVIMLCAIAAGVIGHATYPVRGGVLIAVGIGGLIVGIPIAIVQFGYAMAVSDVEQAQPAELERAIERACIRQRDLWFVNAIVVGLTGLVALLQTLRLFF